MKWINTKVEFTWDSKEKRYKEIDVEGYYYSGPIADCGGFCFIAGTQVTMANNEWKAIEDVVVGDVVLSIDEDTKEILESKVTGLKSPKHNDLVLIKMENDYFNVECTHDHPFYVQDKGWSSFKPELTITRYGDTFEEVAQLESGDKILVDPFTYTNKIEGVETSELEYLIVEELTDTTREEPIDTYIIEVENTHTFFANGLMTHNKGPSLGAGEAVMISGSGNTITSQSQVSLNVGDDVLSAKILGLPDTDVTSEYLLWEYTGSDITTQVTLATSSVESVGESSHSMWWSIQADNGRSNPLSITTNHTVLTWSGSSYPNTGSWYFEYAGDVVAGMKFLSASMEVIDVTSANWASSSTSQSFYRSDIEPYDVYFVDGILIHN
tara:strand:- start:92 stop:1237 length:1146 start_codon:yes stop_codon:yes gene_type:complete